MQYEISKTDNSVLGWVRSRILYRTLDAAMTASLRPKKPFLGRLRSVFKQASNYDRVASIVHLIDAMIPGTVGRVSNYLYRLDYLPFAGWRVELLGYGSGTTVFLLEREEDGERQVLKVYRKSLGRSQAGLLQVAKVCKKRYELMRSWYGDAVLPAEFVILRGPLIGGRAAATLQPYIEGEKKDLFRDFSDTQLMEAMRDNEGLRNQFILFAKRTVDGFSKHALCIDLVGEGNVLVVKKGGALGLQLFDYGIFDLATTKVRSPALYSRIEAYVYKLRAILTDVSALPQSRSAPPPPPNSARHL